MLQSCILLVRKTGQLLLQHVKLSVVIILSTVNNDSTDSVAFHEEKHDVTMCLALGIDKSEFLKVPKIDKIRIVINDESRLSGNLEY